MGEPLRTLKSEEVHRDIVTFALELEDGHGVPPDLEELAHAVIGAAVEVHTTLGPGLMERVYTIALDHRLKQLGHESAREVEVPLVLFGETVPCAFRADVIVESRLVVEVKCVEEIHARHKAQLLTYLRLLKLPLGLVINFQGARLKDGGVRRVINT
ncbi:MAG: GxxExxY protein [Candidatus Thermoplasmatota archaeon]